MPLTSGPLEDAVQEFWWEQGGGMATKWVMVVEGFRDDGTRWCDFVWTEETKTWDLRGLLHEALDSQVAGMVADELRGN